MVKYLTTEENKMRVSRHRLLVHALSLFLIIGLSTAAFADDIYIEDQTIFHNYIDGSGLHGSIDMKSLGILIYSAVHGDIDLELGEYINSEDLWSIQVSWRTPLRGLKVGGTYFNSESNLTGKLSLGDKTPGTPGYHASASYRFTDWFESEIYYTKFYNDSDEKNSNNFDSDYNDWQEDLSLNTRFDLKKFLTIKLGVTFKDYTSDKNGIAPVPVEIDLDRNRIIYQFKATLAF